MTQGRLSELLIELGSLYAQDGMLQGADTSPNKFLVLTNRTGVHACYRFYRDPKRALHVIGHSNRSTESEAVVSAELVDYAEFMKLWNNGDPAEDGKAAVRKLAGPESPIMVHYDAAELQRKIGKRCADIR